MPFLCMQLMVDYFFYVNKFKISAFTLLVVCTKSQMTVHAQQMRFQRTVSCCTQLYYLVNYFQGLTMTHSHTHRLCWPDYYPRLFHLPSRRLLDTVFDLQILFLKQTIITLQKIQFSSSCSSNDARINNIKQYIISCLTVQPHISSIKTVSWDRYLVHAQDFSILLIFHVGLILSLVGYMTSSDTRCVRNHYFHISVCYLFDLS